MKSWKETRKAQSRKDLNHLVFKYDAFDHFEPAIKDCLLMLEILNAMTYAELDDCRIAMRKVADNGNLTDEQIKHFGKLWYCHERFHKWKSIVGEYYLEIPERYEKYLRLNHDESTKGKFDDLSLREKFLMLTVKEQKEIIADAENRKR